MTDAKDHAQGIKCVFGAATATAFTEKCYLYIFGYNINTVWSLRDPLYFAFKPQDLLKQLQAALLQTVLQHSNQKCARRRIETEEKGS